MQRRMRLEAALASAFHVITFANNASRAATMSTQAANTIVQYERPFAAPRSESSMFRRNCMRCRMTAADCLHRSRANLLLEADVLGSARSDCTPFREPLQKLPPPISARCIKERFARAGLHHHSMVHEGHTVAGFAGKGHRVRHRPHGSMLPRAVQRWAAAGL